MVWPRIRFHGSEEQKDHLVRGIVAGRAGFAIGYTEPNTGSDLASLTTRAVRDGDDYVLNGSKIWTTQANFAKYMILLARTNPDAPNKYAGLSFFLCPMKITGIETTRIRKLTGEYGFCQTFFTDAHISAETLLGGEGNGWKMAMRTLEYERGARSAPGKL